MQQQERRQRRVRTKEDALWSSSSSSSSSSSLPPQRALDSLDWPGIVPQLTGASVGELHLCAAWVRSWSSQSNDHDRAHAAMENPKDAFKGSSPMSSLGAVAAAVKCACETRLLSNLEHLFAGGISDNEEPPTTTGRMMPPHSPLLFKRKKGSAVRGGASLAWRREGKTFACAVARRVLQVAAPA